MERLSPVQIAQVAREAGFSGTSLVIAVAVALAESGGNPDARGTEGNSPPSTDRGLWQFNSYWHSEVSDDCAFNPRCAAREAYRVTDGGTNWNAWVTYTNGAYKRYMDDSLANSDATKSPGGSQSPTEGPKTKPGSGLLQDKQTDPWGVGQAIANTTGSLGSVAKIGGTHIMNSGTLLVGLLIIAAGVGILAWLFLNNTQTGRGIKRVGKDAAKVGAAVAVAVPK